MWRKNPDLAHVHYPKCAGHTVRRAFGIPDDVWGNHRDAHAMRDTVGQMEWDTAYKFTFVRNPFDLVVSTYEFNRTKDPQFNRGPRIYMDDGPPTFAEWVRTAFREPRRYSPQDWGAAVSPWVGRFDSQYSWCLVDGMDAMDFVGRVENLEDDLTYVMKVLGLKPKPGALATRANSARKNHDYRHFYDDDTRALVEGRYAEDLEMFGYEF